jgi:DNA-binding PadR family transcriptional regulator
MSSMRLFILGALSARGAMHGHQLRLLAEQEHIDQWTDITVGGLYGALKRLGTESLIRTDRVERAGAYPERQIWAITDEGEAALAALRLRALSEIVVKHDPFDLAMTRLDPARLDELPGAIAARIAALSAMLNQGEAQLAAILRYLSISESIVMKHRIERLRGEILWHQELAAKLPEIVADERARSKNRD